MDTGQQKRPFGISVVICCYNSRTRLPASLRHLAAQKISSAIPWEVIIIDNASTDGTKECAEKAWSGTKPAPLRIIQEPQKGLAYARQRGICEAQYALVSFIDDDNHVDSHWIEMVSRVFRTVPNIGLCGARPIPAPETEPPFWFDRYIDAYATRLKFEDYYDVSTSPLAIKGAGLTLHTDVWHTLRKAGFTFKTIGRKGKNLSSGEDNELAFATALAGYRLWNEPSLIFRHFIPRERLCWSYLRKLYRGFGGSSVIVDAYQHALNGSTETAPRYWRTLLRTFRSLVRLPLAKLFIKDCSGSHDIIRFEFRFGRLAALLRRKRQYRALYTSMSAMKNRLRTFRAMKIEKKALK
jgi:glycosyltransferase involved in cell wall biosynthesis